MDGAAGCGCNEARGAPIRRRGPVACNAPRHPARRPVDLTRYTIGLPRRVTSPAATRTFIAEFYDKDGHLAEASVEVTLTCKGLQACSGECIDTQNDPLNCGACGEVCPETPVDFSEPACLAGKCGGFQSCAEGNSCDEICRGMDMVCADACLAVDGLAGAMTCNSGGGYSCALGLPYGELRCCCFPP
jgi:hypothetical protein